MPTKEELIATEFRASAVDFDAASLPTATAHHMAVSAERIAERAGKLVLHLDSSFDNQIIPGPEGAKWLRSQRAKYDKPEMSRFGGMKDLATETFFTVVRYFTLGKRPQFNEGDFDLLTGFTAGSEIVPWPDWWNEKSEQEKLEYDELLEMQLLGTLPGRIPCKGDDVRRIKPKPVPNPWADCDSAESDALLQREKLSLYARACNLVADALAAAPYAESVAAVDEVEIWHNAAWYKAATGGALYPGLLRRACGDGRITGRKPGKRNEYELGSVCAAYKAYRDLLQTATKAHQKAHQSAPLRTS